MSLQNIVPYRLPNHAGKRLLDPHVVIVGAGASIAACEIDKNGKKVPLLKNIHNILGLTDDIIFRMNRWRILKNYFLI